MKQCPTRECFENKKIRAKGKWFFSCYFENVSIKNDDYTKFFDCWFHNCKLEYRIINGGNVFNGKR